MIKEKRQELELFLRSQTLGPGISGYRFVCTEDADLMVNNLLKYPVIKNEKELLNIVPAAVYSTGILFPVDDSKSVEDSTPFNDTENLTAEQENVPDQEPNGEIAEEEDAQRIDQMFPNMMGLTCCFDESILGKNDLTITLNARYYTKVAQDDFFNQFFGVICECDEKLFNSFLLTNGLESMFRIAHKDANHIVLLHKLEKKTKNEKISEIRKQLRSIADRNAIAINNDLINYGFQLRGQNLSALKQSIFYELKFQSTDSISKKTLFDASQKIELLENQISHLVDLLDINDKGYGLWRSNVVKIDIPFPGSLPEDLKGKVIYSSNEKSRNFCPSLKDIYEYPLNEGEKAALSLNIQLSRDSRRVNNKVFLKVQLVNTSTPFVRSIDDARYYSTFNEVVNQRSFFGVKLSISNDHLIPYNLFDIDIAGKNSEEDLTTKFIYRQFKDYGVGHGCSVKWDATDRVMIETEYIPECDTPEIDTVPKDKELKAFIGEKLPDLLSDTTPLQFKWLSTFSDATDAEVISGLGTFINQYGNWINVKRLKYKAHEKGELNLVMSELDKCAADKDRMINNIRIFLSGEANKKNLRSFRLMNSSMFMQLWHSENVKKNNVISIFGDEDFVSFNQEFYKLVSVEFDSKPAAWRAFQLAFILLNLDGIFRVPGDELWKERNELVDLVWFPTGGGKTEAYLGLISLTIINRRILHESAGGGTAAIMRYTLRLLTQQQFTRATLMIMALENIRRWDIDSLGEEPIYIGLWVGDNSLPNDLEGLKNEYEKLNQGVGSKIPFEYCPWCRSSLIPMLNHENDRRMAFDFNRLHLFCSNEKCSFCQPDIFSEDSNQGPLPVALCDEIIYQHPPALLFGTVDKFAQLAHKVSDNQTQRHQDSRRLFGQGNWEAGKKNNNGYLPPDLIIQDELHLLLGPLGSSVALFESAVDQLCRREDGTRPKIISSTATTRNTQLQIMALFDRKVNLFPKPGVECDDSFFAFYKRTVSTNGNPTYLSKRRYVGILPTGRTQIWMQMRIAAILMTHRAIFELKELEGNNPMDTVKYAPFQKAMDYYHTVISYFNSLKEVGKTESQIHTYLIKEIRRVFNRVVRPEKLMHSLYTYSIRKGELTGRLSGEEVKNELQKVGIKWVPQDRFVRKGVKNGEEIIIRGESPPDFVVATNMISVGLDVSRFNLMIMNSMPRNIAEYIQASSRVARDSYGMVITIHHPFRARDMSHYEKFIEFHEKMYSYVEPISITPFTKKALDRYLGLYLATMLRQRHSGEFTKRGSAGDILQFTPMQLRELKEHLSEYFIKRMNKLIKNENDPLILSILTQDNVNEITNWISDAIEDWQAFAENVRVNGANLVFSNKHNNTRQAIPQEQLYVNLGEYDANIHSYKWQIPMSLRVIEPAAAIKIKLK